MSVPSLPAAPPSAPQFAPSLSGAVCRWIFRRCGWRLSGDLPNVAKMMVIVAPHSSAWDVIWGLLLKVGMRLDVHFIGKREAFVWPIGPVLRNFGGIAIDRKAAHGVVGAMRREFESRERFWLTIAPEGTRKPVKEWKSGFWRIARAADVPIQPVYFHYPGRTIGFGPLIHPSDDADADMARIREFYRPWQGKNRGTV